MTVRFEPHGHDHPGFWGDASSSIDWYRNPPSSAQTRLRLVQDVTSLSSWMWTSCGQSAFLSVTSTRARMAKEEERGGDLVEVHCLGCDLSGWMHRCERNYVVSFYIAEFFNTFSSFAGVRDANLLAHHPPILRHWSPVALALIAPTQSEPRESHPREPFSKVNFAWNSEGP